MKVLIIANYNTGHYSPFIVEQVNALRSLGIEIEYYGVVGKGAFGYLSNRTKLIEKIKLFHPDIIHAHYGLSGLMANLQRRVPVITTYHGSDINMNTVFPFSYLCMILSKHNIFVSEKNRRKGIPLLFPFKKGRKELIPCGVNVNLFLPSDKQQARKSLSLDDTKKYVLFAGAFHNTVKNATLAKAAVEMIPEVELLELKGYSREQVVLLMNAVDAVLMTSLTEGSPQFIKEAMACNCPIVSVDVGDVQDITENVQGCYICSYETFDVVSKLKCALLYGKPTEGRKRIIDLGLDSETVAKKIQDVYNFVINNQMK